MNSARMSSLDWLKFLGMALIVLGHVGGAWIDHLTPPFFPKQLGVAFFLFAAGVLLAREQRSSREVLFRRLFEVYLVGVGFAILMSVVAYLDSANLAESNYLPFLVGINIVLNAFPANPTTWYIGTYIHGLLLWALVLRHLRIQPWMIILTAITEVVIRSVLMEYAGLFRAYMLLPNWATVFLLGLYQGQQANSPERRAARSMIVPAALLAFLVLVWPPMARSLLAPERDFPFMRFSVGPDLVGLVATSAAVTVLYSTYTWTIFRIAEQAPTPVVVHFFCATRFLYLSRTCPSFTPSRNLSPEGSPTHWEPSLSDFSFVSRCWLSCQRQSIESSTPNSCETGSGDSARPLYQHNHPRPGAQSLANHSLHHLLTTHCLKNKHRQRERVSL